MASDIESGGAIIDYDREVEDERFALDGRRSQSILIYICAAPTKTKRVLRDESLERRAVVAGAIEVEAGTVVFTAGKLIGITITAAHGRRSERLIRVVRSDRAAGADQAYGRAQGVGQKTNRTARVCPRKILVDTEAGEE